MDDLPVKIIHWLHDGCVPIFLRTAPAPWGSLAATPCGYCVTGIFFGFFWYFFDVFEGNPYTTRILNLLRPAKIFVYGVSTNVCVDKAVCGLIRLGYKVYVFEDAIKELPKIPLPFKHWKEIGVKMIDFGKVKKYL